MGSAGLKFAEPDDPAMTFTHADGMERAEAVADHERGAPAQFADQGSGELPGAGVEPGLNGGTHPTIELQMVR